jgi:branched-chain amino acid transport system permease protein
MTDTTVNSSGSQARPKDPRIGMSVGPLTLPQWKTLWLGVGVLAAVIAPFMLESYYVFQATQALIYAIAIVGLNLLTGYNGQFSLGHSTFFAIGAYSTAIMMNTFEMGFYSTIIPAAAITFVFGFLFGLPALRLDGLYLALATFALATATPQLLKYEPFAVYTGGVQGLDAFKPDSPVSFLDNDQWMYFFVFVIMILMFWLAKNIVASRTGRALIAIRDNPLSAKTMGVNSAMFKSGVFGVSAMFTGVAGSLSAVVIEFVAPESFLFTLAVLLLVGSVLGGVASIYGALFGGAFILLMPNISESMTGMLDGVVNSPEGLTWAVYGILLIAAVYLMPGGVAHLVQMYTRNSVVKGMGYAVRWAVITIVLLAVIALLFL